MPSPEVGDSVSEPRARAPPPLRAVSVEHLNKMPIMRQRTQVGIADQCSPHGSPRTSLFVGCRALPLCRSRLDDATEDGGECSSL